MKHAKLNILALFMIHFCIRLQINPYSEQTSYYENRSLCKHGKIDVRHFGLTYFRTITAEKLKIKAKHNFNILITLQNSTFINKIGRKKELLFCLI